MNSASTKLHAMLFLESNKVFRQLIEGSHAGVYIADADGNLRYVNPAFARMLGYSTREELVGKNLSEELYVDPEERLIFLHAMEKMGFVRDYPVRNKCKDGSIVILAVTSNWIKDDANQIIGIEGVVQDITEKALLEESFREEKEDLKEILSFEESLNLIHNVDQLGKFAVRQIAGILKAQKCSFMLYDQEKQDLFILAAYGLLESTVRNTRMKMGEAVAGMVARERVPVLVSNIEYDNQFQSRNRPYYVTRSFMSVPVMFGPHLLGVINVADKLGKSWQVFSELDLKMLCIMARAVGIALENSRLFSRLEDLAEGEPWASMRARN